MRIVHACIAHDAPDCSHGVCKLLARMYVTIKAGCVGSLHLCGSSVCFCPWQSGYLLNACLQRVHAALPL